MVSRFAAAVARVAEEVDRELADTRSEGDPA